MIKDKQIEKFFSNVVKGEKCWEWKGFLTPRGYGRFNVPGGKTVQAHRFCYEIYKGSITEGLQLDHLCRNRACVNPDHLEPVTGRENVLRGNGITAKNAQRTHCIHGHLFDEKNTSYLMGRYGRMERRCRTCYRLRMSGNTLGKCRNCQWKNAYEPLVEKHKTLELRIEKAVSILSELLNSEDTMNWEATGMREELRRKVQETLKQIGESYEKM